MIVIGGYNSGNTQRLAAICREIQPSTYHIETARELNPKWLAKKKKVGLTAGASTPSWIIKEVETEIRRLKVLQNHCGFRNPDSTGKEMQRPKSPEI
jgi:4-hydroxy-3-methylbut-2-enyl diphosphate reductase